MEVKGALGPYRLVRELGRGAFGAVYEALDPRLGRAVAIKQFPALPRGDPKLERFLREAKTQASVAHPNVVRVFDSGFDRGVPYLVLELVRGESLRAFLARTGTVAPARALELMAQVARGVEAVHQAGLVHRDLKPENILLDELGTPRVADFGIVRELMAETLTQTGSFLGTPEYMAPEQAASERQKIGPRTDVWSLGCVLQELVSGKTPFSYAADLVSLLAAIETRPPAEILASTPVEHAVRETVTRCLRKKPEERFESAAQFERACQDALLLEAPVAPRRGMLPLALLSLMMGVVAGIGWRVITRPPPPVHAMTGRELLARARAGEPLDELSRQPCADDEAVTVESGLRAHDAALLLLVRGKLEEARAAAVPSTALGDLIRREAPPSPMSVTLVPLAVISHGLASTARVAVAGETIFTTGPAGGPVRQFSADGKLLGLATREHSSLPRSFGARGSLVAWTGPRGVSVAHTGLVREHPFPGARAVALDWTGAVIVATDEKVVIRVANAERTVPVPFPVNALAVLDDGVVALGPGGGLILGPEPTPERFVADDGPLDALADEALFARGSDVFILHHRAPEKLPFASTGRVTALRFLEKNEIAVARGPWLEVLDRAGHALAAPESLGDDAVSLAVLEPKKLITGLRRRPARIYERRGDHVALVAELEPGEESVVTATFTDPGRVETVGWDGARRTFEISTKKLVSEELLDAPPASRAPASGTRTLSPDGRLAAIVDAQGLALVTRAGDIVARAPTVIHGTDPDRPPPLAWSEDGKLLVAGSGPITVLEVRR